VPVPLIEAVVVAIVLGGLITAVGYAYEGAWPFIKRWALAVIILAAGFWGGAAVGAVARNAMCQGFWICE